MHLALGSILALDNIPVLEQLVLGSKQVLVGTLALDSILVDVGMDRSMGYDRSSSL